ncbi:glycosyltransferase family 4 protein [Hymenobacter crusticola]|uniref:Glycosyltransferase subfamily 4-like N-terminal domain-containing protein n=1 Tax=Hymenobacter crusticola TaxID=1770526 RepID=A0A243WJK6_9BACT|nr:glycosyltransferase family 4 protein [Hymenobacter crusticola]OUJ76075.1 hypothetical protein BXP70_02015 [Hymenobacter crusticola]
MNILLTSLIVPSAPSGVRVHYERLASQLRTQGHTVTLVTQDSLRPVVRRVIGVFRRSLGVLFGKQIGIELTQAAEIFFAIDRSAQYDVVNAQDPCSGWAARLALRDQAPVVVTGHFNDHPAEELIHQQGFTGLTARFLHHWYNFLLGRTRFFIGVSDYVRRRSEPWLAPDARHTVVYNGLAMNQSPQAPAPTTPGLRQQFAGRPVILNVGQLEARKNQRYLVQAAAELKRQQTDFALVLVGQGEDETLLRQMIADADLGKHVFLLGYHRDIMTLLRSADLYVHAALRENCPLVLIEAMAAQCPAVALAVGGIPELLADTPDALVLPTAAPSVMAERLQILLSSATKRQELQQRQHNRGEKHFDASVMLRDTLAFFDLARRGASAKSQATTAPSLQPTYPGTLSTKERV